MNPDSIAMKYYRKEKVLTIVGAFFVACKAVYVLRRNHCQLCLAMAQILHWVNNNQGKMLLRDPGRGSVSSEMDCLVLNQKMKLENFRGLSGKTEA